MDLLDKLVAEQRELHQLLEIVQEQVDDAVEAQAAILRIQALAMATYDQCLIERIELLKRDEPEEPTDD